MKVFQNMAVTTAGVLLLWQGSVYAGGAQPSLSDKSDRTASSAEVVSSATAYKQVAAIYPNPSNANVTLYWMTDGSYSEWDNAQQKFTYHSDNPPSWFAERGWPAGKQVAAVYQNPSNANLTLYWMTDGSYSEWDNAQQKFTYHSDNPPSWFADRGWPAGKQVAAVYPNPTNSNLTLYWMTDGTYSEWDSTQQRFTYHSPIASVPNWFGARGWPAGKRVAAVYQNPNHANAIIYWMTDGFYSHWDNTQQHFTYHSPIVPGWFVARGWPKVSFDPSRYEVRDIRINEHSPNGGAIYANGKMQYKVVVRVQIQDSDGKGVYLGDRGTGGNQARQARDLVTLYLGDKRVDTPGANLAIDGEGDHRSNVWQASRFDAGYDKLLSAYHLDPDVMYEAYAEDEHDSDEMDYSANDGWNTYTYWVSTTQQTGPDPMRICARVGAYGQNGEGYYDSCANGRNESARVRSQAPKHYGASDYIVSHRNLGSLGMGDANHNVMTVGLKGATIRSAENMGGVTGGNNGDVRCVATFNHYWSAALGNHWNSNTSLYFIGFGREAVAGPHMYAPWSDTYPRVPASGLDTKKINFIETTGAHYIVTFGRSTGTWTNCRDWSWSNHADYKIAGRVKFLDGFGNEGIMTLSPVEWSYVVQ
ncbi:hypothetical protein QMX34_004757 [Aeromonas hydrophila]|nr:hypothetical protein [Aeromonas hydrophila]